MIGRGDRSPTQQALLKWAALACLVTLQVLVGVLYKVSQTGSNYTYSTYSALAMAEAAKFGISASIRARQRGVRIELDLREPVTARSNLSASIRILALALMYFVNNQLTFALYLRADPASINMLKSGSSILTALVWCVCMGRLISASHWAFIVLQVTGLFLTQYDSCKDALLLATPVYAAIAGSVLITAASGVWNEHQLKTLPPGLHEQNMVLYAGGFTLNLLGHAVKKTADPDGFPGFFQGYGALSVGVVLVNACFGVTVTAVYKYADAVMKTLASAVTTVVIMVASATFFGLQPTATNVAGCITIIVAVALYSVTPQVTEVKISARLRLMAIAVILAAIAIIAVITT